MHKIIVENECGCFKRSNLENNIVVTEKNEALGKAIDMKDKMNEDFCGKHGFKLAEDANNFVITFAQKSGCCGGGHCS